MDTTTYPPSSLRYILPHKTAAELRTLAQAYYVKGYSKMKKAELVDAVCAELQVPERMEELLYVIDDPLWRIFQRAAKASGAVTVNIAIFRSARRWKRCAICSATARMAFSLYLSRMK